VGVLAFDSTGQEKKKMVKLFLRQKDVDHNKKITSNKGQTHEKPNQ